MEAAHDAAFQERPETVDRLSMNCPGYVLASAVPDNAMLFQVAISGVIVSRNQADFFGDSFADEAVQSCCISILYDAGPVLVLAADVGFIDFDDAHELAEIRTGETGTNAMTHIVRSGVGAETHHPVDLQRSNAILAGEHQIDDLKPCLKRYVCVFKDRSDQDGEPIGRALAAFHAFPFEGHCLEFEDPLAVATRATHAIRPTPRNEVGPARIIVGKQFIKLRDGHLFGELWGGHRSAPDV